MTRRSRGSRRVRTRYLGNVEPAPWSEASHPDGALEPSLRERLERASVPARALLPVRFFFGATFVYAGLDKLLDPAFFDASSPASIYGQLQAFTRVSPLAPLVRIAEPFALPMGLLIALAEIAIGLGALTGLAYRLAAAGGAALSFLFFLTASWSTHPFYYGPDLPYAFGWVALALAGAGELLVPRAVREIGEPVEDEWMPNLRGAGYRPRGPQYLEDEVSPLRRQVLQAGVLGAAALVVASLSVPIRLFRPRSLDDAQATGASGDGSSAFGGSGSTDDGGVGVLPSDAAPTPPAGVDASPVPPSATPQTGGLTIATIADVDQAGAKRFRIPGDPSGSLPAGDPGIIVRLGNGSYAAFDATCTHAGCRVGWDAQDRVLLCPCHGAAFDPSHHGEVLGGPTNTPLLELPLVIDKQAGTISIKT
jgi:thiosulfate dehydrogenase [quinone] large subunit